MSLITAEHLRALRNAISVVDVIVDLGMATKTRGARLSFRCPDCRGYATATNKRTNLARCFRCERNFNTIELVLSQRSYSFREAVVYLERLLGAPPSPRSN